MNEKEDKPIAHALRAVLRSVRELNPGEVNSDQRTAVLLGKLLEALDVLEDAVAEGGVAEHLLRRAFDVSFMVEDAASPLSSGDYSSKTDSGIEKALEVTLDLVDDVSIYMLGYDISEDRLSSF